jgi:hypothetical protein
MKVAVERNTARRGITLIVAGVTAVMMLVLSFLMYFTPASAGAIFASPLPVPVAAPHAQVQVCGNGSAPDYGFTYEMQQAHWTVGWQGYASEQAVTEVDAVLDRLNGESIAQTMILIQPQVQVGNRVNCAVHFLRYMQLGLPDGERKDNGFVFLIVVEPTRIDVHYGVGLGLPALTASELTTLNRAAEDTYQSTHSMDEALLTLVQGFDTVARSKYAPLILPTPISETINLPALPSGPLGILTICGLSCIGVFVLLFLLWLFTQMSRMGISFNPSGSGYSRGGWSSGGSSPRMRGGSGSGRSGRGN